MSMRARDAEEIDGKRIQGEHKDMMQSMFDQKP